MSCLELEAKHLQGFSKCTVCVCLSHKCTLASLPPLFLFFIADGPQDEDDHHGVTPTSVNLKYLPFPDSQDLLYFILA